MSQSERDVNDAFEDIFLTENKLAEKGYREGFEDGVRSGNAEAYHLGFHRGAEVAAEIGYYLGVLEVFYERKSEYSDKTIKLLEELIAKIKNFPDRNDENYDIIQGAVEIRDKYKKLCTLLKYNSKHPDADNLTF